MNVPAPPRIVFCALALSWPAMAAAPGKPTPFEAMLAALPGNSAVLQLDGVTLAGNPIIAKVVDASEVVEYKDGEDGTMHTRPGNHKPGRMTVTRDWSNDATFYQWRQLILTTPAARKSISIIFHNDAGEEAGRFNLLECWPVAWVMATANAKNSGHATETIEISYETLTIK